MAPRWYWWNSNHLKFRLKLLINVIQNNWIKYNDNLRLIGEEKQYKKKVLLLQSHNLMFHFGLSTLVVIGGCFLGIIRHEYKLMIRWSYIFSKETVKICL